MDSKILVRILIIGLTAVLMLISFTEKDFLQNIQLKNVNNNIKILNS